MRRGLRVLFLIFLSLLILGLCATAAAAASADIVAETTGSYDADDETFDVEYEYALPSNVREMTVTFRDARADGIDVVDASNVDRVDETTFEWNGGPDPTITLRIDPNDPQVGSGAYADGNTGFVMTPSAQVSWRYTGSTPALTERAGFDGTGHASTRAMYAGPHERHTERAGATTVSVVVPDELEREIDAEAQLAQATDAAGLADWRLEHDRITLYVVPGDRTPPRQGGQAVGNVAWVGSDSAALETIDSVPAHELAHVFVGSFGSGEMMWLTEASGEYYGYLIALNGGRGSFDKFRDTVGNDRYDDAVLTDPGVVRGSMADYQKGANVLAGLDAEIRRETDGEATLLDVLTREGYDLDEYDEFKDAVVDVSGQPALAGWVDRYVDGEGTPPVPDDRSLFTLTDATPEAFSETDIRTTLESPPQFRVDGYHRETPLYGSQPDVWVGERVSTTVTVENAGDEEADRTIELLLDGRTAATETVHLEPGAAERVEIGYEIDEPGRYEVRVDDATTTVTVREPASPRVDEIRTDVDAALGVETPVDITVSNPSDRTAIEAIPIEANGERIDELRVGLEPDQRQQIRTELVVEEAGTVTLAAGNATAELTVHDPDARESDDAREPTREFDPMPGFGVTAVLGAVAVAFALVAGRVGRFEGE